MWKKFLSVVLSVSMFVCPLSIFAAQTNQFEEVCNFYDYANQDLISSNRDGFLASVQENFKKYYNKSTEYIIEHANDFDSESDIGKMAQLRNYLNSTDEVTVTFYDGGSWTDSPMHFFNGYSNIVAIQNILFSKQTLAYLKERNTNVFGTDNIEELNRLRDTVAYLDENLQEIIYSSEESLIEYIKSLPLSNAVKEDMEREILKTQVVDFGFLRSYDYLFNDFSLEDVTLLNKDSSMSDNINAISNLNDELGKKVKLPNNVVAAATDPCSVNAYNTSDTSEWGEDAKYMDTKQNFVIFTVPSLLAFTLNGGDLESDIIDFSETLGHEFGHLIQRYSPANIDYFEGQYSACSISQVYSDLGRWGESSDFYEWGIDYYNSCFKQYLNNHTEDNTKYSSVLQVEDIPYFDDLHTRIKNHFESMPLEDMGYSETERIEGDAVYNEVFSDIYGLNTVIKYIIDPIDKDKEKSDEEKKVEKSEKFEKIFKTYSQFLYEKSFDKQEPNEEKRQELRTHLLYGRKLCSYPVNGFIRTNGVLTMIPEYVEWAKEKARAYHPEFSATDEDTGVQVQADMGKLIDGVKLNVNKLNKGTEEYNNKLSSVDSNIKDQIENIEIYSVSIVDRNGSTVQPEDGVGLVKLRIPIPQGFDKSDLSALYIAYGDYNDEKSKGNIVNLNGTDYYEFEVKHFSDYSLIDELTTYEKLFWPIVLSSVVVLAVITTSIVVYNKKKKPLLNSK